MSLPRFTQANVALSPKSMQFLVAVSCIAIVGCQPDYKPRVYDAPKVDTEFVVAPPVPAGNMAQAPKEAVERRTLGAFIPIGKRAYFVKAMDSVENIAAIEASFRTVVERFSIDPTTGLPSFELPDGWVLKPRSKSAMADQIGEFSARAGDASVRATIFDLDLPSTDKERLNFFLLDNINRWRGQLRLPPIGTPELEAELTRVDRPGSTLPTYIFDRTGLSSGGMGMPSGAPLQGASKVGNTKPALPEAEPVPPKSNANSPSSSGPSHPVLSYAKPDSWEIAPEKPFRWVTFHIADTDSKTEVVVSKARNAPVENAAMWLEQLTKQTDRSTIEPLAQKVVETAEDIAASGDKQAKLYTIRSSEQADAPTLLVVVIPTSEPDMCVFVKLVSDSKTSEQQKPNLLSFVNSLKWE